MNHTLYEQMKSVEIGPQESGVYAMLGYATELVGGLEHVLFSHVLG